MCNISKLYNSEYIDRYLKKNRFLIANICSDYTEETFNMYLTLYNKYKDKYLCDWFPSLWAIVFYKNSAEQKLFIEMINAQAGTDIIINSFTSTSKIDIKDNQAVIIYNNRYQDFITFDQEKNVG